MKALKFFIIGSFIWAVSANAYNPEEVNVKNETPKELEGVGVEENLGEQLDLSLKFTDDLGNDIHLGQYFDNNRPVLMAMVYYNCPGLCNYQLNGLTETFKQLKWKAGVDYKVVAVSMDPTEKPDVAAPKKANYIKEYGISEGSDGWHFLTGSEESVKKLADQLGFKYKWIEEKNEFAHSAVAYVVTPGGQISRYLHGISFLPATLKMALLEASNGKIGNVVERVLSFCFVFDPKKSKYTLYAWNVMQLGATVTAIILALFLIPYWIRERKKKSALKGDS